MYFGFKRMFIDDDGMPTEEETQWVASCFILFTHVIWVGKVKEYNEH